MTMKGTINWLHAEDGETIRERRRDDDGCWCGNCGGVHPAEIDSAAEIERLRAEIERLQAENRLLHDTHRWNIKPDGDGLLICTGAHEKHEHCQFYRYRMVEDDAGSR